ncbi:MAG: hypothetical protein U5L95_04955 [Candidatus Saccharibacteria bacterium]|nr:hypothetical protein [Candidatus Saccharibacteria bacterium]
MKFSNTIKLGVLAVIVVIASLLIGYIVGIGEADTLQDSGTKAILVIGVVTLAFIAVGAIAGNKSDKNQD